MNRPTEKPRLKLLIGTDDRSVDDVVAAQRTIRAVATGTRNWASHLSAVIPPVEAKPGALLPRLILQMGRLIEVFVVIDAEDPSRCRWSGAGTAKMRCEEQGREAEEHDKGGDWMKIRDTDAT